MVAARGVSHFQFGSNGNGFIVDCVNAGATCVGIGIYYVASTISTNLIIEGNTVRNYHGSGITIFESQPTAYYTNVTIQYNTLETPATPYATGDGSPHPIYLKVRGATVRYNSVVTHDNDVGGNSYGIHCYHICTDVTIAYNYITNAAKGRGVLAADFETALPGNNQIYGNVFRSTTGTTGVCVNIIGTSDSSNYYNNVCDGYSIFGNVSSSGTGNKWKNNVCAGTCSYAGSGGSGVLDCGGTCTTTNPVVTAATHFTSPSTGDYTLKSGSSLIDAGLDVGLPYNGSAPDQGAHETFTCTSGTVATNIIRVQCNMNLHTPLVPGASAGWTVNNSRNVTGVAVAGSNAVDVTFDGAACTGVQTWTVTYSTAGGGTATDTANIGGSRKQTLFSFGPLTVTNNCAGVAYTFTQTTGTAYESVAPEATARVLLRIQAGGAAAIRTKFKATGGDPPVIVTKLQYATDGESGTFADVPDTFDAGNIRYVGVSIISGRDIHGTAVVTERLTSEFSGMTAGSVVRCLSGCETPSLDLSQDAESEQIDIVEFDTDAVVGTTYHFRRVLSDGTVMTYAANSKPSVTIASPAASGF
jgi:hypothetical protein